MKGKVFMGAAMALGNDPGDHCTSKGCCAAWRLPSPLQLHDLGQNNESKFPSSRPFLTTSPSIIQNQPLGTTELFLELMHSTQSTATF